MAPRKATASEKAGTGSRAGASARRKTTAKEKAKGARGTKTASKPAARHAPRTSTTGGAAKPAARRAPRKSAAGKTESASRGNYTDPALRERLKAEVMRGSKGGKPGQWSARKAQLLAHEYQKAGGGYTAEKKTKAQEHLDQWTNEDWKTRDGQPAVRGKETARYLPKTAWQKLSPSQERATDARKKRRSRAGERVTSNTAPAKRARKAASPRASKSAPKTAATKKRG